MSDDSHAGWLGFELTEGIAAASPRATGRRPVSDRGRFTFRDSPLPAHLQVAVVIIRHDDSDEAVIAMQTCAAVLGLTVSCRIVIPSDHPDGLVLSEGVVRRMTGAAGRAAFNAILISRLSSLGEDMLDALDVFSKLRAAGVDVYVANRGRVVLRDFYSLATSRTARPSVDGGVQGSGLVVPSVSSLGCDPIAAFAEICAAQ